MNLYILSHNNRDYYPSNYKILQIGADYSKKDLYPIKDNTGDNISAKNRNWLETTGIYWIWKNVHTDIKGQMQNRRFLSVNPQLVPKILESYDIILANPVQFTVSVFDYYKLAHNINDLLNCEKIISRDYPEYLQSFEKYLKKSNIMFYSNSFIAKSEIYDNACEFVFGILQKLENEYLYSQEMIDASAKEAVEMHPNNNGMHAGLDPFEYQRRIFGYLFERIFTLYVLHNNLNIYLCGQYIKMEDNMLL